MTDLRKMAQMTPNERKLALRWLEIHAHEYDLIVFQARLGDPPVHTFQMGDAVVAWPLCTWLPRPDFIAWRGQELTIGEIKANITFKLIGQIQAYADRARRDTPEAPLIRLIAIGGTIAPGVEQSLAHFDIHLELFPDVELVPFT
jgi:hypothetical protein